MISNIYCVYDSQCEFYSAPFLAQSKGEALRSFMEAANDDKTYIGRYPAAHTLFELGTYDNLGASYVLHSTPLVIGLASEYVTFKGPIEGFSSSIAQKHVEEV